MASSVKLSAWVPRSGGNLSGHLVLAAMALWVVAACSSDTTYLPALKADPMASYEAPGLELLERFQQGRTPVLFSDAFRVARIFSEYEIKGEGVDEIFSEVVAAAEASGWVAEEHLMANTPDERFVGAKDFGVGLGRIVIYVSPEEGSVSNTERTRLVISIGFDHLYSAES